MEVQDYMLTLDKESVGIGGLGCQHCDYWLKLDQDDLDRVGLAGNYGKCSFKGTIGYYKTNDPIDTEERLKVEVRRNQPLVGTVVYTLSTWHCDGFNESNCRYRPQTK